MVRALLVLVVVLLVSAPAASAKTYAGFHAGDAGEVQPREHGRRRAGLGAPRARARAGDAGGRGLLPPGRGRPGEAPEGLAGVGGRPARERARGPLGAGRGASRRCHAAGPVRLLPRLARQQRDHRALRAGRGRGCRVRAPLGHAGGGERPAPGGPPRAARRPEGGARRALAGRVDRGRLRDLGLRRACGRARSLRARADRRRRPPARRRRATRPRAAAAATLRRARRSLDLLGVGLPWTRARSSPSAPRSR